MSVEELFRTLQEFETHAVAIFPGTSLATPYSNYSSTNYVASGLEIPKIHDVVSQRRDQLNVIDTILERTKSVIHQLNDKREQIVSWMKIHEGLVSSIRSLPTDVLSDIFMHCLPDNMYLTPDVRRAPLLLTRVCRRWREVALSTPRLWCSLSIADTSQDSERRLSLYRYWLANSSGCPLSLKLHLTPRLHRQQCQWNMLSTEFSQLYTSRCTELDVCFDAARNLDPLLVNVPILEQLTLTGGMDTIRKEQPISIVQPRPRLHTLTIEAPTFDPETLSFFNPGWTNLTRLAVLLLDSQSQVDNHIFLALLKMCPNLEHFVFSPFLIQRNDDPVTLTHSKLRMLNIHIFGGNSFSDTLIFPDLRHLRVRKVQDVHGIFNDIPIPIIEQPPLPNGGRSLVMTFDYLFYERDAFMTVFNPSWAELTRIRVDTEYGTHSVLLPLEFCPRLEHMVITIVSVVNGTHDAHQIHHNLRSLTLGVKCGSVDRLLDALTLPGLRHLELRMKSGWPHEVFKQFVSRSNCPLETLTIRGAEVSIEEREELGSLIPTLGHLDLDDKERHADRSLQLCRKLPMW